MAAIRKKAPSQTRLTTDTKHLKFLVLKHVLGMVDGTMNLKHAYPGLRVWDLQSTIDLHVKLYVMFEVSGSKNPTSNDGPLSVPLKGPQREIGLCRGYSRTYLGVFWALVRSERVPGSFFKGI